MKPAGCYKIEFSRAAVIFDLMVLNGQFARTFFIASSESIERVDFAEFFMIFI